MMPRVYERDISVCTSEPTVGFAEKGFVRQEEMLYPSARNQLKLECHERNPKDGVPTLIHGGKVVAPSGTLIDYFYDAFTQPPARPADPYLRRRMSALPGPVVELIGGDSPERRQRALQQKMNSASRAGAPKGGRARGDRALPYRPLSMLGEWRVRSWPTVKRILAGNLPSRLSPELPIGGS